ncbi:hypothetical protein ABBQ38_003368 [Trebouxia sp. C0009 RCD-2024]
MAAQAFKSAQEGQIVFGVNFTVLDTPDAAFTSRADATILVPDALPAITPHTNASIFFQCPSFDPSEDASSAVTVSTATPADVLLITQEDYGYSESSVHSAVVHSILLDVVDDAIAYHDLELACAVDAVVDELVSNAVFDAVAACCAILHDRAAGMAVDSVLDDLITDTVAAGAEAAQAQVVPVVLQDPTSTAVVAVTVAQPKTVVDLVIDRAVDAQLEELLSSVTADVLCAQMVESAAMPQQSPASQPICPSSSVTDISISLSSTAAAGPFDGSGACTQPQDTGSEGGASRQQVQQLRREMQQLSRKVPLEVYQEARVDGKVRTLGQGPHWLTILSAPSQPLLPPFMALSSPSNTSSSTIPSTAAPRPSTPPSTAGPCVLKLALVDTAEGAVGTTRLLAQQALLMLHCAHPNVLPISFLGVQPPPLACTPVDPTRVVYIASPWADISLEKRLGQEAWGRCAPAQKPRGLYQGPPLSSLLEYGKSVVHALAHVQACRVLHRALTPDHVLLFNKQSSAARRGGGVPAPIKFTLKLGGFGSALQLDGQGCAPHYPPYRCGAGFLPPEAQQGSPLTPAADVYQFGGLCYFMALGSHPPNPLPVQGSSTGMAEVLLPGSMPEEWRAMIATCWASQPEDRPTVSYLQHHLMSLQHRLRASRAATASRAHLASAPSCNAVPTRDEPTPSAYPDNATPGGDAGQPVVLPKLLRGLEHWFPAPSVVYVPLAPEPEGTSTSGQSVHSLQRGDSALAASEAAGGESIAAVHERRVPPSRGDSARGGSWSWAATLKGKSAALQAAVKTGMEGVSAKTADVMQQLADSQLSAKSGNTESTSRPALF